MSPVPPSKKSNAEGDVCEEDSEDVVKPPDGGWGWVVVFASFMIHIIADGMTYTFGIFYVEFLDFFGEGNGATAWIASILVGVTLGAGPISSAFVNIYGCRPVTIAGSILASLGLMLSVFAPNILTLYITIGLITGLGLGLIYLPAIVSVTCYFESKRAFATGIAVCGSGIGTFIFAPLTEWLVVEFRWKGAMLIISGLVLNCAIFGALFRPVEEPRRRKKSRELMVTLSSGDGPDSCQQLMPPTHHRTILQTPLVSHTSLPNTPSTQPPSQATLSYLDHLKKNVSEANLEERDVSSNCNSLAVNGDITRNFSTGAFTNATQPLIVQTNGHAVSGNPDYPASATKMTCSQPVLNRGSEIMPHQLKFGSHGLLVEQRRRQEHPTSLHGPMQRMDIFYRGSLHQVPLYRSNPRMYSDHVTRKRAISEQIDAAQPITICGCINCSPELHDTLKEMMDMSLLKDIIFIVFAISNFCTSIGFNVPYVYIVDRAMLLGIDSERASFLLAVVGIANTVGRVILGYLSDKPWINRLWLYNVSLIVSGLATAFSAFCHDYTTLVAYAAVFGFSIGAYVGLTSVILVDLLGLDKLTNAFGLLLLFQGVASLIGPPIAGWLKDGLGSYDPGFYVAGIMVAFSGVILFVIPCLQRWKQKRMKRCTLEVHFDNTANGSGLVKSDC